MQVKEIKDNFIKVIQYSQGINEPKVDKLFDLWLENKQDIIEAFGGKYIYELPEKVSFELTQESKENRIDSFIDLCWSLGLEDLSIFLGEEKEGFFSNTCSSDYKNVVTKGSKLVKAFKHFVDNPKLLTDLQNQASQIIQENKIEGRLCFSVHPLDFLSISENGHNWRSCHALDGEYRAGNLSYMMDKSTVVCYLKSDEDVKLPHFPDEVPWNSKKWRVLLYLSNDWKMIFAGKQYPFSTPKGMDYIIDCFNRFNESNFNESHQWAEWTDTSIEKYKIGNNLFDFSHVFIPLNGGLIELDKLVVDEAYSCHFNDVLKSSTYKPVYTYLTVSSWRNNERYVINDINATRFNIGARTYCMHCGKIEAMEGGSGTMMCYDCERDYGISENDIFGFCPCCDGRIVIEDSFWVEDAYYCESCFNSDGERCPICGDYYFHNNMTYDEKEDQYYCKWCYNNNR